MFGHWSGTSESMTAYATGSKGFEGLRPGDQLENTDGNLLPVSSHR